MATLPKESSGAHLRAQRPAADLFDQRIASLIGAAQREAEAVANNGLTGPFGLPRAGGGPGASRPGLAADTIAGYQILQEIHRGGQGVVYQALQKSTQRHVAIKVMREGPFADAGERHRFEREVRVLAQLSHPHIVTIHDSGTAAGCQYFVMDYIRGQPLDVHMAGRRRGVRETLELFVKIADAVNAAHLRGVIHRDLKPSNIRIDEAGQPHVLDFGLAKVVQDESGAERAPMTMTGQFVGSLPWASPEQAEGAASKIDTRTDVYSLGVVLFQMLTGRLPYDVTGPMAGALERIIHAEPLRPRSLRRDIDDDTETIVLRCLQKERERRYQNAGALAQDVRRYLAGEPIEAKRDSTWYVLQKTLWRRRGAVIAGALIFLSMLAAIVGTTTFALREARQRSLADRRAAETNLVADFEAQTLASIELDAMAASMRKDIVDQATQSWRELKLSEEEIARRREALEAGLAGVSFTTTAQRSLDRHIFDGPLSEVRTRFADQPLLKARLLQILAFALRNLELLDRAEAPQTEALEIRQRLLGADHPDTLSSLHEMADLAYWMVKNQEAERYARAALAGRRKVLGDNHLETLATVWLLGSILQRLGRYEEAERYLRLAWAGQRRVLGESHPDTVGAVLRLGQLLMFDQRYPEAEKYVQQAIDIRRAAKDAVGLSSAKTILAHIRYLEGRLDEAESLWQETLGDKRRWLSDDSRDVLFSQRKLGLLLLDRGRLEEAEPHLQKSLDAALRTMLPHHPYVVYSHIAVARLRLGQGRRDEVETHLRESLGGYRHVADDISPDGWSAAKDLVMVLQQTGRIAEAESVCRDRFEACRAAFGAGSKYTRQALDMLELLRGAESQSGGPTP